MWILPTRPADFYSGYPAQVVFIADLILSSIIIIKKKKMASKN